MALTATATPQVADDICAQLQLSDPLRIIAPVHRSNLILRCLPRHDRRRQLDDLLSARRGQCGIVYCRSRRDTEEFASHFAAQGHRCAPFHARLSVATKNDTLTGFMQDRLDIVFATVAFGMGIDRPDVRFVIHAAMPGSLEAYVQECGRAGRDGLDADCILLHSGEDIRLAHHFIDEEDPPPDRRRSLETALRQITAYSRSPVCRHHQISDHFGQRLESDDRCATSCDVCRGELEGLPAEQCLMIAEAVLELLYSLDRSFGRVHIAGLLAGSRNERIRKWRHDEHQLHGRLKAYGEKGVRSLIDQLESHGLVAGDRSAEYPVLGVGPQSLDHAAPPFLMVTSKTAARPKAGQVPFSAADGALFERLKDWRRALAQARSVPAYRIVNDRSLKHLATIKPTSREELRAVHGFGAVKVEDFADELLPLFAAL
jgi:ATP-dependent DNA helicase RecQ